MDFTNSDSHCSCAGSWENSTSLQNGVTETGGINTELFIWHFTHMEKGQSSGGTGCWEFAFPSFYCWDTKGFNINVRFLIEAVLEYWKGSREKCTFISSTLDFICRGTSNLTFKVLPSYIHISFKSETSHFHLPNYCCNWLLIVYLHSKSMFGSSTIHTLWNNNNNKKKKVEIFKIPALPLVQKWCSNCYQGQQTLKTLGEVRQALQQE